MDGQEQILLQHEEAQQNASEVRKRDGLLVK